MKSVGSRIRRLREEKEWSQLELAKKVHINNSVLSRIESGKRPVEDELIIKLASLFNVTTDYILGCSSNIRNHPHTIAAHHDSEDWTEEELEDIKKFKEFVRMKREQ